MLSDKLTRKIYTSFFGNKRRTFNDFSKISPEVRQGRITSDVMQFYSSNNNIGNYLPVLGIQEMLELDTDTWCIHDKDIDFDFVNRNYKCVVIGGAGLLHECFEDFWQALLSECKLPMIMWGIGVCLPDASGVRTDLRASVEKSGVSKSVVSRVAEKCTLINVRDNLTADYYGLEGANISACPTIVYVEKYKKRVSRQSNQVLFSSHKELVDVAEQEEISKRVSSSAPEFCYTDNIQRYYESLDDILINKYCRSRIVVTTRLHGAIISYGLGIPYIAIPRDQKLREFCDMYSNGTQIERVEEIGEMIEYALDSDVVENKIKISDVRNFGIRAKDWMHNLA